MVGLTAPPSKTNKERRHHAAQPTHVPNTTKMECRWSGEWWVVISVSVAVPIREATGVCGAAAEA